MSKAGKLEAIWIKRAHRGPMDKVDRVQVIAGKGLLNNADQGGQRQVTIIEKERWAGHMQKLGASVEPVARRANLMVSHCTLAETRGQILQIGNCRLKIRGHTAPCERMDEAHPGLKDVMIPNWGGGAYAEALNDGEICVGDEVRWVED